MKVRCVLSKFAENFIILTVDEINLLLCLSNRLNN